MNKVSNCPICGRAPSGIVEVSQNQAFIDVNDDGTFDYDGSNHGDGTAMLTPSGRSLLRCDECNHEFPNACEAPAPPEVQHVLTALQDLAKVLGVTIDVSDLRAGAWDVNRADLVKAARAVSIPTPRVWSGATLPVKFASEGPTLDTVSWALGSLVGVDCELTTVAMIPGTSTAIRVTGFAEGPASEDYGPRLLFVRLDVDGQPTQTGSVRFSDVHALVVR